MGRKFTILAITSLLLVFGQPARAQQTGKIPRIGYVQGSPNFGSRQVEAFRQGLRDQGYVEGRNIIVEWRHTNRRRDKFPEKMTELVRLGVACIVTVGNASTRAAKEATNTIPIVMADADSDPIETGLIASYAHPGGNVTGVTSFASDLSGKRIELLKELVPRFSRLAVLFNSQIAAGGVAGHVEEIRRVAMAGNLALFEMGLNLKTATVNDLRKAFDNAVKWKAEALLVVSVGGMAKFLKEILGLTSKAKLPAMYTQNRWATRGGLMSYSADIPVIRRRAAAFVDKILKGANPADLPVEKPTKFELVINLKTAKTMGVTFPPSILLSADKIIE